LALMTSANGFFRRHDALAWRACMALCRLSAHMVASDWRLYQGNSRGDCRSIASA